MYIFLLRSAIEVDRPSSLSTLEDFDHQRSMAESSQLMVHFCFGFLYHLQKYNMQSGPQIAAKPYHLPTIAVVLRLRSTEIMFASFISFVHG